MSQATIGTAPYANSNLFSTYYLDERVRERDAWDCDADAEREYERDFSLDSLREEVYEDVGDRTGDTGAAPKDFDAAFSTRSTTMWSRLTDLFGLIDAGDEGLGIPAYNGGLFDPDEHAFLEAHRVADRYVAEVLYRLSTTEADGERVLADYGDLDTRHLGSIYEGLLEHQFRIAGEPMAAVREDGGQVWEPADEVTVAEAVETVERGALYVVNDEGERKATGAYYTPDYVVTYIVEETVDPLLDEIRDDLRAEGFEPGTEEYVFQLGNRVLDLRICDPAMGSGHFLTKATGYLAEQVQTAAREAAVADVIREEQARRRVAKECIYGVDLNPMAVVLAKLSMWLETLAADQPLAFLNHHLKTGNSLVGSEVEAIDALESDVGDGEQPTLAEFGATRAGTMERLMDVYEDFLAIDDADLDDVKEMERRYAEIQDDALRQRLVAIADMDAAADFGVDIPDDALQRCAAALTDDDAWADLASQDWFRAARATADEEQFFHWRLEFPEVFYDTDGSEKENPGFDAVIGNPPWLGVRTGAIDSQVVSYLKTQFTAAEGQFDLAAVFLERGTEVLQENKTIGFVVPKRIASNEIYEDLREHLAVDRYLTAAIDLGLAFEGVSNDALILLSAGTDPESDLRLGHRVDERDLDLRRIDPRSVEELPYYIIPVNSTQAEVDLVDKINTESDFEFGDVSEITRGAECGMNHDAISTEETEDSIPAADPSGVGPYAVTGETHYVDTNKIDSDTLKQLSIYQSAPKLLARFLSDRLIIARDDVGLASTNLVYHIQTEDVDFYCGLLSSDLLSFWYMTAFQTEEEVYPHVQKSHLQAVPVLNYDGRQPENAEITPEDLISSNDPKSVISESAPTSLKAIVPKLSEEIISIIEDRADLNLDLRDYLGSYDAGATVGDWAVPAAGVGESPLAETAADRENLRLGSVTVERDGDTVRLAASARYKPADPEGHETDQWGYTETEPIDALRFVDCDEREAALIQAFVPLAVDEAGGFADFRETATKTNSLLDRLRALTLPAVDDVADGLERYVEVRERATELDRKIERTDDLIDAIVYELYGLTEEEIEIVEAAVEG